MKGVTKNPLADEPVKQVIKPRDYVDEFSIPVTTESQKVMFQGRVYAIHVMVKSPSDEHPTEVIAKAILGVVIRTLLKNREAQAFLAQQNISTTEVLGPKVTFDLESIVLHVAASSSDLRLAQMMGVDRLAVFLSACKGRIHGVKSVLDAHGVSIASKA